MKLHVGFLNSKMEHSMKDSSTQEFHGLFTERFQAVSKFGKWIQYTCKLGHSGSYVILHLWLLIHWVNFPNLETAWELQVNKECKHLCTAVIHAVEMTSTIIMLFLVFVYCFHALKSFSHWKSDIHYSTWGISLAVIPSIIHAWNLQPTLMVLLHLVCIITTLRLFFSRFCLESTLWTR